MAISTMQSHEPQHIHPIRIVIAIIIGIILLTIAITLYHHNHQPPMEMEPTNQSSSPPASSY